MRWMHRIALACLLASICWVAAAQGSANEGSEISAEFWLGLGFTVVSSLIVGYTKGIERRVDKLEKIADALHSEDRQLQAQISLLKEQLPERFHAKAEVTERFDKLEEMIGSLHRRMDYFAAGRQAQPFPGPG